MPSQLVVTSPATYNPDSICITCDVEWAHSEVLDYFLCLLAERHLRGTFFCTHPGIVAPAHELSLHPNFSLQGDMLRPIRAQLPALTDDDVFRHVVDTVCGWYPQAIGIRGHRRFFDSALLPWYRQKGIEYESGCYLPFAQNLEPAMLPYEILEIPMYYIDYSDLAGHHSGFEVQALKLSRPGIKVFNFHPNIVFINAASLPHYMATKAYYHDPQRLSDARHSGRGIGTLFVDLLDHLADRQDPTLTMSEVNGAWRANSHERPMTADRQPKVGGF